MLTNDISIKKLSELSDREYIATLWGEDVLEVIDRQHIKPMSYDRFLYYCHPCGGNWCGMLLYGIKSLYPEVYEAIPNDMGMFAWECLNKTLTLLGITE